MFISRFVLFLYYNCQCLGIGQPHNEHHIRKK